MNRIKSRGAVEALRQAVPAPIRRGIRRAQRAASYLPRRLFGTITHVVTDEPVAALTFDDGPDPRLTPRFLEALEAHGARATFFLLGQSARRHPELVARIRRGGHAIGNHSWDHRSFPALSAEERRRQIRACAEVLGGGQAKLFRPPCGNQTFASRLDPLWLGWDVVTWNISGTDWTGDGAEQIAERILSQLRPGSIVLLHDVLFHYEDARFASREETLQALTMVLEAVAGRYRLVTVPELLRLGRANRELWIRPGDADYLARLQHGEIQGQEVGR